MLTLMAVHAHPDDEASTTGGILAKYSAEGIRTVLVTCTNGELGDTPTAKPGDEGHDTDDVVAMRTKELQDSCAVLGVDHLEMLGFHDSGMMGWPQNDVPGSFWSTPVEQAAKPLVALIEKYQPDVVVTYDDFGFYGHPDHIQAHRITLAALDATGCTAKLYFPTFRLSAMAEFRKRLAELGVELPQDDDDGPKIGVPDEMIGATIEVKEFAQKKFDSLAAHVSQAENIFFLKMPMDLFTEAFGTEEFIRARPDVPGASIESDLFAGLR